MPLRPLRAGGYQYILLANCHRQEITFLYVLASVYHRVQEVTAAVWILQSLQ